MGGSLGNPWGAMQNWIIRGRDRRHLMHLDVNTALEEVSNAASLDVGRTGINDGCPNLLWRKHVAHSSPGHDWQC